MKEFLNHVQQATRDVQARSSRKCAMRDELLAHLTQAYTEEFTRCGDPKMATANALRRLGNVNDLSAQLQASVPLWERIVFQCIGRKETLMSRVLWMTAVVLILGGGAMVETIDRDYPLAILWLAGCVAAVMVGQRQNIISRSVGPDRPWYVGVFSMLFGMAIILPALAKMKEVHQALPSEVVIGLLGAMIVLTGIAMLINGVVGRRVKTT